MRCAIRAWAGVTSNPAHSHRPDDPVVHGAVRDEHERGDVHRSPLTLVRPPDHSGQILTINGTLHDRIPPARVVQAATSVRTSSGVPAAWCHREIGLLELASGFMATRAVYAAAKLGIADVLGAVQLSAVAVAAEVRRMPMPPTGSSVPVPLRECSARRAAGVMLTPFAGDFARSPGLDPAGPS